MERNRSTLVNPKKESVTTVEQERDQNLHSRFLINIMSNLVMLALNVIAGLWLTPYLIGHLGVAAYGLVPLATSITSYLSVINSALNSAIGRFLTIELRQGRLDLANRTFNTALWGSIGVGLVLVIPVWLFSHAAPSLFDVPAGQEQATISLFAMVMFSYLFGVARSSFAVSTFARNRLDLQNVITASNLLIRLAAIALLFELLTPRVWHVGLGILIGMLFSIAVSVVLWRRLTPGLVADYHAFDCLHLRDLLGMSGWMTINQVGALLFLNLDLVIVNIFLGADTEGRYGSVMQWPILLRTFAGTISGVLTPVIIAQYARGEIAKISSVSRQAVKLLGLGMALPVGIICGLSAPILVVWLGNKFVDLAGLMAIMTAHLCVNLAVLPLFSIQVTLGRVKWPGIVTLLMGVANLLLALWWVGADDMGLGVALAGGLVLTLKNALFTPFYGAHIEGLRWNVYLFSMIPGVAGAAGVALAGYGFTRIVSIDTWFSLGVVILLLSVIYGILVLCLALDDRDRTLLKSLVPW